MFKAIVRKTMIPCVQIQAPPPILQFQANAAGFMLVCFLNEKSKLVFIPKRRNHVENQSGITL